MYVAFWNGKEKPYYANILVICDNVQDYIWRMKKKIA